MTITGDRHGDLALAHRLADTADAIALRHLAHTGGLAVRAKGDGSPVTEADREIEGVLRELIRQRHPYDAFLGEEYGEEPGGPPEYASRRWIVDGIDGTAAFVAGEPEWSTLIALEEGGEVTLGMVSAPALDRRWWAVPGSGAWSGACPSAPPPWSPPSRLTIPDGGDVREAVIGVWPPPARLSEPERAVAAALAAHTAGTRPVLDWSSPAEQPVRKPSSGSGTCHGALLVATGQLDAFLLLGAGAWDVAALVPIVQEAGGTFGDLTGGQRTDTGAALFARRGLQQRLLQIVTRW